MVSVSEWYIATREDITGGRGTETGDSRSQPGGDASESDDPSCGKSMAKLHHATVVHAVGAGTLWEAIQRAAGVPMLCGPGAR
jgi:hypothetical protein